jgi:hypothetical protein
MARGLRTPATPRGQLSGKVSQPAQPATHNAEIAFPKLTLGQILTNY